MLEVLKIKMPPDVSSQLGSFIPDDDGQEDKKDLIAKHVHSNLPINILDISQDPV